MPAQVWRHQTDAPDVLNGETYSSYTCFPNMHAPRASGEAPKCVPSTSTF